MLPPVTAAYDACVLYSAVTRDLLIRLAQTDLVRGRWTDAIHEEWMRSLLRDRPDLLRDRVERTRQCMDRAVPDCLVVGYEPHVEGIVLPDQDDRHVVAAAIQCRATAIVTFNLKDFPASVLSPFGIRAVLPDDFVSDLFDQMPSVVHAILSDQRSALRSPPKSIPEFLAILEQNRMVNLVDRLRRSANQF